jgi:hypothetical protein
MNLWHRLKHNSLRKKVKKNIEKRDSGNPVSLPQELAALHALAKFYLRHIYDKGLPRAEFWAQETYRAAAILGDKEAQYRLGLLFLERGKFWQELRNSLVGNDLQNHYARADFQEAFDYLQKAADSTHPLALRSLGMAYVRGWGVEINPDKGFKLVISSIDAEKSWDKATKIFEQLGLNSPEFFSALGAMKQGQRHG